MAQADLTKLKQELTRRMDGALETLKREFNGLRTGRAHPGLLEPVKVQAYGSEMPLAQIGTSSIKLMPSGRRYPSEKHDVRGSACASCAAMVRSASRASKYAG